MVNLSLVHSWDFPWYFLCLFPKILWTKGLGKRKTWRPVCAYSVDRLFIRKPPTNCLHTWTRLSVVEVVGWPKQSKDHFLQIVSPLWAIWNIFYFLFYIFVGLWGCWWKFETKILMWFLQILNKLFSFVTKMCLSPMRGGGMGQISKSNFWKMFSPFWPNWNNLNFVIFERKIVCLIFYLW